MMRGILIWAALACCESLLAQGTFNKRFDLYGEGTGDGAPGVENTDYGLLVFAQGKDPEFPHYEQLWLYGLDHSGELLFSKVISNDSLKYYAGWCNSTAPTADGNYILGGSGFQAGVSFYDNYLIKFTPEGDTLWKSSFYSDMQYLGYAGCQAADGGYALTGITQDVDSPEIPWYNGYIMKVNSAGDFEWLKKYYHLQYSIIFISITGHQDGGYVAAGHRRWLSGANVNKSDFLVLRTDNEGNEIWRKAWGVNNDDYTAVANISADGNILIAGSSHDDLYSNLSMVGFHYAAKLNISDGSIIWERYIEPSVFNSTPLKVFETVAGDVIVGGDRRENFPLDGEPWYEHRGSLWKLSAEGDSLWLRTYAFADGHPCHFRDVIETPDGGFAAVGVAEISPGYESDDTWVVKVDQHGCLVPGCHLVNVEELEAKGGRMLVYPNPVKDVLNVYLETSPPTPLQGRGGPSTMSLIDLQGRTVKQWRVGGEPTTYMADVSGLGAGVYLLRYEGGGVVLTEKVVVE